MLEVWTLRLMGAGGFGVLGWRLGRIVSEVSTGQDRLLPWGLALALTGVPLGAIVTPYLVLKPLNKAVEYINGIPGPTLIAGTIGLLVGLVVASLLSIPLYTLDGWPGLGLPLAVTFVLGLAGISMGVQRAQEMQAVFPPLDSRPSPNGVAKPPKNNAILVDTSAIIDGRIADLTVTGFVEGALVVPRFILDELRHIADSSDPLRRNRGRRGLEVLGRLRQEPNISLEVLDVGVQHSAEVDSELVHLARSMNVPILTTDYNLNRVAELQEVQVLNVNELANALKSIVLPGENLRVNIVQEGKEPGQGVAYLDDGTMVVVEGGRRFIGASHDVVVTRVLQTAAGRIIFAQPR